jgi:IclR helix-turn-helix domain
MQHEPAISKAPGYLVPCVFKAVQMLEALRKMQVGLRVEDFLLLTGYSRSTIYRILRTLTACSYVVRGPGGTYRLDPAVIRNAENSIPACGCRGASLAATVPNGADEEFERWGIRFGPAGRRAAALSQSGPQFSPRNHAEV